MRQPTNTRTLTVTIQGGTLTYSNSRKVKTFLQVGVSGVSKRTGVIKGQNPMWCESFDFDVKTSPSLEVKLYEKGLVSSSEKGKVFLELQKVIAYGLDCQTVQLMNQKGVAAKISVQLRYSGGSGDISESRQVSGKLVQNGIQRYQGQFYNPQGGYPKQVAAYQTGLKHSQSQQFFNYPQLNQPYQNQMAPNFQLMNSQQNTSYPQPTVNHPSYPPHQHPPNMHQQLFGPVPVYQPPQYPNPTPPILSPPQQYSPQPTNPALFPENRPTQRLIAPTPLPEAPRPQSQFSSKKEQETALAIVTYGLKTSDIRFEDQIYKSQNGKQVIYNAKIPPRDTLVAVKITYCKTADQFNVVQREAMTMCQVSHPNICKVYASLLDSNFGTFNSLLVMEKCQGGDLSEAIDQRAKILNFWSEPELFQYFRELIGAFAQLQIRQIVHSDIKPQNIAITPENKAKIIDFGISLISPSEYFATTSTFKVGGTVPYFSPLQFKAYIEYISGRNSEGRVRHNPFKSDVFSLGLTFYHMASLQTPTGMNDLNNNLETTVSSAVGGLRYSGYIKNLLISMLAIDENRRVDFLELQRSLNAF